MGEEMALATMNHIIAELNKLTPEDQRRVLRTICVFFEVRVP